jgi:hypothetical protein
MLRNNVLTTVHLRKEKHACVLVVTHPKMAFSMLLHSSTYLLFT